VGPTGSGRDACELRPEEGMRQGDQRRRCLLGRAPREPSMVGGACSSGELRATLTMAAPAEAPQFSRHGRTGESAVTVKEAEEEDGRVGAARMLQ
jgi:hypothetical protein